jgi:hypothetical protein
MTVEEAKQKRIVVEELIASHLSDLEIVTGCKLALVKVDLDPLATVVDRTKFVCKITLAV